MRYGQQYFFRTSLVAFAGVPLVGKTTLAKALEQSSNYICVDVDEMRWQGREVSQRLSAAEEQAAMENAYLKMHNRAKHLLEQGQPAIVAATYSRPFYHDQLKVLARTTGVCLKVFYLEVPSREEVERRLEQRRMHKDGYSNVLTYEHFASVQQRYMLIDNVDLKKIPQALSHNDRLEMVLQSLQDLRDIR